MQDIILILAALGTVFIPAIYASRQHSASPRVLTDGSNEQGSPTQG